MYLGGSSDECSSSATWKLDCSMDVIFVCVFSSCRGFAEYATCGLPRTVPVAFIKDVCVFSGQRERDENHAQRGLTTHFEHPCKRNLTALTIHYTPVRSFACLVMKISGLRGSLRVQCMHT